MSTQDSSMPILEIRQVVKSFGGLTALSSIDLKINEGEIRGLIGPNGSGKTTLFNVISGFYKLDSGQVLFRGKNVTGWRPDLVASQGLARTFQNALLFDEMTGIENVKVGLHRRTKSGILASVIRPRTYRKEENLIAKEAEEILAAVGIGDLDFEKAKNLSYGKRRLLELARALAMKPSLILLDEPTAGLNESESISFITVVKKLRDQGYTILLVEHDMRVVMDICDQISVLDYGKKIAEGSPSDIQQDSLVIEAYLGTSGRQKAH